jgi:23S rRNA (uracil1939-C5)-methyltransferase
MRKGETIRVEIESLGAAGDGRAVANGRPVFVPLTLPGEVVDVRLTGERDSAWHGEVTHWETHAPERVVAPCSHFGDCGGCALQHLDEAAYSRLKMDRLTHALNSHGLSTASVAAPVMLPSGTRRRTRFAAHHHQQGVAVGYRARGSRWVVEVSSCLLLTDHLNRLMGPTRELLSDLLPQARGCEVSICETATGVDMVLHGIEATTLDAREELAAFAGMADLARLSLEAPGAVPETVVERRAPVIHFGDVPVPYPAGAFLQPSEDGEAALAGWVRGWLGHVKRVADLYAGLGSLSVPLAAAGAGVHAVEGDARMTASLEAGAHQAQLRITAENRDLARQPVNVAELKEYDAVIFDPPRAGARAQAELLAVSNVPLIAAVSCNAATFARDALALTAGGYEMLELHPLDQFPYSPHLELAALFRKN